MKYLSCQELKKNLKRDFSSHKNIKLAILGESVTQLIVQALRDYGHSIGVNFEIFESDYDQIERHVFDSDSGLHKFDTDFVLVFHSARTSLYKFSNLSIDISMEKFSVERIIKVQEIYDAFNYISKARVIYCNSLVLSISFFVYFLQDIFTLFINHQRSIIYKFTTTKFMFYKILQCISKKYFKKSILIHTEYYSLNKYVI